MAVFRMSHDCAVVSYGVVFSFIIAFRFLFEDVNLVFHCLAGMVCRNKCRVYLSNNQIPAGLFATISYLCGGTVKLNCYEKISASLYGCAVLLYAVGSGLW